MIRTRDSKSWRVAVLAHPFECAFAVLFVVVGVALALKGHEVRLSTVQLLPRPIVIAWEVCLLIGGPAMMAGLVWRGSELMGRAIERAGCYLAAAVWASYAIVVAKYAGTVGGVAIAQGLTITLGCLVRAWALTSVDRTVAREEAHER